MILYALILGVVLIYLFRREGPYITVTGMTYALLALIYGFGHLYYYNIQDFDETARTVTASLGWMWCALILGNEICRLSFPRASARQRELLASWSNLPMTSGAHAEWLWRLILLLSTALLAVAFVAFGKLGTLSAYATLMTAQDVAIFRRAVAGQGGYPFQLFVTTIAPFLAVMALLIAKFRPTTLNRLVAAALITLVLLFKISTYQKTQWVWLLITLGLGWYLARRIKMRVGTILVAGALIFLAFMIGAFLAFPGMEIASVTNFVLYRVFEICNEGLYQTYYVYPHYLDHTHGLNIGLVHAIYGYGELIPAHTQVARFFGSFEATYNAMFIADAWVDFGVAGVIVVSTVIGFLLKAVDLFVATLGKTPVALAITASLFFGVISLASVSAFTSLLTGGIVLLPIFVIGVDAVGARLSRPLLRGREQRTA